MENSNFSKVIILVLAGLTIWNTFRTESCIEKISTTKETLSDTTAAVQSADGHAELIAELQREIGSLQKRVKSLESQGQKSAVVSRKSATSSAPAKQSAPKVEAKVRVDNRYVQGRTPLPAGKSGVSGTVTVEVRMNQLGMVGSATVTGGTISDEDILHSCKEAALKTDFAYNPSAPTTSVGTITYTFN